MNGCSMDGQKLVADFVKCTRIGYKRQTDPQSYNSERFAFCTNGNSVARCVLTAGYETETCKLSGVMLDLVICTIYVCLYQSAWGQGVRRGLLTVQYNVVVLILVLVVVQFLTFVMFPTKSNK